MRDGRGIPRPKQRYQDALDQPAESLIAAASDLVTIVPDNESESLCTALQLGESDLISCLIADQQRHKCQRQRAG
jgi:hypothetical protein